MAISAQCVCGKTISAKNEYAGKRVRCPACKEPVSLPTAETDSDSQGKPTTITTKCECGKSFRAKSGLLGKTVKCPACSMPVKIGKPSDANGEPAVNRDVTNPQNAGEALEFEQKLDGLEDGGIDNEVSDMSSLLDELGLESSKTGMRCPNCKQDITDDAVLCIDCGFNLETGKVVKKSSFVKEKKSDTGVGAPKKAKTGKGLFRKKS